MTVFVILGIVALFMFGIVYFVLSGAERAKTEKLVETRERLQGQVKAVEGYVTSCLQRTAGNAILKLGRQGGLRFPCQGKCIKDDAGNEVAYGSLRPSGSAGPYKADPPLYPFDVGRFAYPWLASGGIVQRVTTPLFLGIPKLLPRDRPAKNSIQEQLEDEVAATLGICLNLRTAFPALSITTGIPNVSVAFGNATQASTATNFMLTFPVTISSEAAGALQTRTVYVYKAPFAFDKIYDDAAHIITEDIKDMLYNVTPDASVERRTGRPDDIIRLDTNEELNNEKFYFQFGRENRRPALECVEINRDCNDDSDAQYKINLWRQSGSGQVLFNMFLLDRKLPNASLVIIPKDCNGNDGFSTGILGAHASSSHKFVIPGVPFSGKIVLVLVDDAMNVAFNSMQTYSSGPCVDYDVDTSHPRCTKKCVVIKPNAPVPVNTLKQGNNTMDIALCTAKGTPDGFDEFVYTYRIPLAAQDADEDDMNRSYQLVFELQDEIGQMLGNGAAYSAKPGEVTGEFTFHLAVYDEDAKSIDWQVVTLPVQDCGGGVVGGTPTTCANGRKDGQESDIDCGGTCPRCVAGRACEENGDCKDGECEATKTCGGTPRCDDKFKNGDETDTDCGGSCTTKCLHGKGCKKTEDCATSLECNNDVCGPKTPDTCLNGAQDSGETDVDCGGPCQKCTFGKHCGTGGDCSSGLCDANNKCTAPPADCTNGIRDGDETDVDCGGNDCPEDCDNGKACTEPDDCKSGFCDATSNQCKPHLSTGESCANNEECNSGTCDNGACT
ncbi:hypothetical protein HY642_00840 [Candidatus Woesearchaeota archaeon]|nr:hypothetical protein [Candidatus Woesearchaeota archaeon]